MGRVARWQTLATAPLGERLPVEGENHGTSPLSLSAEAIPGGRGLQLVEPGGQFWPAGGVRARLRRSAGGMGSVLLRPEILAQDLRHRPRTRRGEGGEGQAGLGPGAAPGARVFLLEHGGQMAAQGG
jgi:hypothetical protein